MRTCMVLYCLLFGLLLSASCRKGKEACVATLSLHIENRSEAVEWMEVSSGRQDQFGEILVSGWGYNDEQFTINLRNIFDTGIINNLTLSQLSFTDGAGFRPQQIRAGFIRIVEKNQACISGVFEVSLADNSSATKVVKADGSFRIYGHD